MLLACTTLTPATLTTTPVPCSAATRPTGWAILPVMVIHYTLLALTTLNTHTSPLQRGYSADWLGGTFSQAVFLGNGLMAILSGAPLKGAGGGAVAPNGARKQRACC